MKKLRKWCTMVAMMAGAGAAQAALVDLGDGTVKDTATNLIWLKDWSVNGFQSWATQKAWAEGLDFAGSTDWRLPEIGEYETLFSAFGNLTLVSAFQNVRAANYWSGTAFAPDPSLVFAFDAELGITQTFDVDVTLWAVAVRPDDVAAVPEPVSVVLLLAGLGALGAMARRPR